jgi:hypothetical protein
MFRNFASPPLRRIALAGALAAFAAASFVGSTTPTRAFGMRHGGGGGLSHGGFGGFNHSGFGGFNHGGFGGFRHEGFHNFHHGFDRRFAFGFGGFPAYYDYAYDECLRREWGPYGWSLVNICY